VIRALRERHRKSFYVLAALLPLMFAVALAKRETAPVLERLPGALAPSALALERLVWERESLWDALPITTRLGTTRLGTTRLGTTRLGTRHLGATPTSPSMEELALELVARERIALPDLLVYWSPASEPSTSLAAGARLLGTFAGERGVYALPAEASRGGGLLLYSLARAEVIDTARLDP